MVKVGIGLLSDLPISETIELAKVADENNFDYVWIADENPSPGFRDVFITLSGIAVGTKKVKIDPGVVNPYSRHPALIAVAMASLNELSNGRAVLGLGVGGSLSLRPLGLKMWEKPIRAIRDTVSILNQLFLGETVNYDGIVGKLVNVKLDPSPGYIPIYLAARKPKMLRLTGEVADGVLLTSPLEYISFAIERIKEGAKKANRDWRKVDIANWLPFAIAKTDEEAREMVKFEVCFITADSPDMALEMAGISLEKVYQLRDVLSKKGVFDAVKLVTDEMIDALSIAGTVNTCKELFKKYVKEGVTQIILSSPFGKNPKEAIEIFTKEILPELQK